MIDEQMKKYFLYITISLCGLLVTACQQETLVDSAKGGFAITLLDETAATDVMTKASPLKLPASVSKEFHLTITKNSNGYVLYDGGYTEEVIPAAAATYTVKATFGEENILEVNNPYFVGEEDNVEVKAGDEPTTVELACKLANALTSVRFGEGDENRAKFDELYAPGYGVKIAIGHYSTVLTDSMKVAYYKAGTKPADVTLAFVGTIRGNGQAVEYPLDTKQFPQLAEEASYAAGAHIRLVLDMAEMATGLVPTIVYAEVVKETVTETFPMEWLPKPQVEARGDFDAENKILFYETEQPTGSIKFNSALGLQDLKFTVAFNDPTYSSLNGDYTLSTMTDTEKQAFATAGIILPVLGDGAENDSIGFTKEFITALTYSVDKANDKKEVSNVIQLTEVKANDKSLTSADVAEGELEFEVAVKKAPTLKVTVDERNIWSKSFTVEEVKVTNEAEGADAEAVKAGAIYQYSIDGSIWYDFGQKYWDGSSWVEYSSYPERSHMLESRPDNGTVRTRAKFREFYSSVTRISLEEQVQLPNSDMEAWGYEQFDGFSDYFYFIYPWNESKGISHYWDTNNLFTTRSRGNTSFGASTVYKYNNFCAVSLVSRQSGGYAAEIRSTVNGRGNTVTLFKDYNKVAGELYTGTTTVTLGSGTGGLGFGNSDGSKDTYSKTKNALHPSRPTGIRFWYKYVPFEEGETCKAEIQLLDVDGNVITKNEVTANFNTTELADNIDGGFYFTLPIPYDTDTYNKYSKCKYIYVCFYSTINPGEDMPYEKQTYKIYVEDSDGKLIEYENGEALVGSVLTIDDISLIYDK